MLRLYANKDPNAQKEVQTQLDAVNGRISQLTRQGETYRQADSCISYIPILYADIM
jgi:hypothetical protein